MSESAEPEIDHEPAWELRTTARLLEEIATLLEPVAVEHRLLVSPDGLVVTTTDPANVLLVDLRLDTDALDLFELGHGGPVVFQTDVVLDALSGVRSSLPRDADVRFAPGQEQCVLEVLEADTDDVRRRVSWPAIDLDAVRPSRSAPEADLRWRADVGTNAFVAVAEAFEAVQAHPEVAAGDSGVRLSGTGHDPAGAAVEIGLPADGRVADRAAGPEDAASAVSCDYLDSVAEAIDATRSVLDVSLGWGQEQPVAIDVVRGVDDPPWTLTYWLAPRITDSGGGADA